MSTLQNPFKPQQPSALQIMASRMSVDSNKLLETLKATVFKNATNEELLMLVVVSNDYNLNPMLREIYAFPAKGGGIVPIVSVDGWNKMLVNQPDFDGIEFDFVEDESGKPLSCTATIHVKNRAHPVKITEYFSECRRNTDAWNTMPHRMLRNRTLCQASRIAFGFSGVKHEEEADTITVDSVVDANPAPPTPEPAAKPAAKEIAATSSASSGKPPPQAELETLLVTNGYTFDDLQAWGEGTGNIENAMSMAGFADLPTDVCRRLLRAQAGLLKGLEKVGA